MAAGAGAVGFARGGCGNGAGHRRGRGTRAGAMVDVVSKAGYGAAVTSPDELETAAPLQVGRPLDTGYLIDEVVGEGSAGRVWRGRRATDGEAVAIKVLHPRY